MSYRGRLEMAEALPGFAVTSLYISTVIHLYSYAFLFLSGIFPFDLTKIRTLKKFNVDCTSLRVTLLQGYKKFDQMKRQFYEMSWP
jgi:hypothetical protein